MTDDSLTLAVSPALAVRSESTISDGAQAAARLSSGCKSAAEPDSWRQHDLALPVQVPQVTPPPARRRRRQASARRRPHRSPPPFPKASCPPIAVRRRDRGAAPLRRAAAGPGPTAAEAAGGHGRGSVRMGAAGRGGGESYFMVRGRAGG